MGISELSRVSKSSPDAAESSFRTLIDESVREKVKPVPDFLIHKIAIAGEPVFVLEVKSNSEGPYSTHDNDVYIRKGATNRKPDPITESPRPVGKRLKPPFSLE